MSAALWSPQEVFLFGCRLLRFVAEEPKNSNRGQAIDFFHRLVGLAFGQPWCMMVLTYIGHTAWGRAWPLPLTASCSIAAEAARKGGYRFVGAEHAEPGDIVAVWYPLLGRFGHVWVVAGPKDEQGRFPSWEGNTNPGGSREGYGMFQRLRRIGRNDRVIKWAREIEETLARTPATRAA